MAELPRSHALTEPPGGGLFTEAPAETLYDALTVTADERAPTKRLGLAFWIPAGVFLTIVFLTTFARWLPIHDPEAIGTDFYAGVSLDHPLGTNEIGQDMFARTVYGARIPLIVGSAAVAFGLIIGGGLGLFAGFYRGKVETLIMGLADVLLAFPAIVLALAMLAFLGQTLWAVVLVVGIIAIAPVTRIARANTLVFAQREFVVAARALGSKRLRTLRREILPNVLPAMLSFALIGMAIAIVATATLDLIGVGVKNSIAWGGDIIKNTHLLSDPGPHHYLPLFAPCAALLLTVLSLNLAGDRLRAYLGATESRL